MNEKIHDLKSKSMEKSNLLKLVDKHFKKLS